MAVEGIGRRLVVDSRQHFTELAGTVQGVENVLDNLDCIDPGPGQNPHRGPQFTSQVSMPVTGPTALHGAREGLQTVTRFCVPTVDRRHAEPRQHKPFHVRNDTVALLQIRRMAAAHSPRLQPMIHSPCMTDRPDARVEPPPAERGERPPTEAGVGAGRLLGFKYAVVLRLCHIATSGQDAFSGSSTLGQVLWRHPGSTHWPLRRLLRMQHIPGMRLHGELTGHRPTPFWLSCWSGGRSLRGDLVHVAGLGHEDSCGPALGRSSWRWMRRE